MRLKTPVPKIRVRYHAHPSVAVHPTASTAQSPHNSVPVHETVAVSIHCFLRSPPVESTVTSDIRILNMGTTGVAWPAPNSVMYENHFTLPRHIVLPENEISGVKQGPLWRDMTAGGVGR